MLKIIKRKFPLEKEGEINRLNALLEQERQKRDAAESSLVGLAREADMVATRNYDAGSLIIVDGILYKAIDGIPMSTVFKAGVNVKPTTIADEIAALQ